LIERGSQLGLREGCMSTRGTFIEISMLSSTGQQLGQAARTTMRRNSTNPVYGEYLELQIDSGSATVLRLKMKDHWGLLGEGTASIQDFGHGKPVKIKLGERHPSKCWACFSKRETSGYLYISRPLSSVSSKKTLFLIRHGESEWNQAVQNRNLAQLWQFDHPLTVTGVMQACNLRKHIQNHLEGGENMTPAHRLQQWCEASLLSSPLARALGTALLCLEGHRNASQEQGGIRLCSLVREVKSMVSLDCVASTVGDEIHRRVTQQLGCIMHHGASENLKCFYNANDKSRMSSHVDPCDAVTPWWSRLRDSKQQVNERIDAFMRKLQYSGVDSLIVVGHSNFFRRLANSSFMSPNCEGNCADEVRINKIPNAGCVVMDVVIVDKIPQIQRVETMFGTKFG